MKSFVEIRLQYIIYVCMYVYTYDDVTCVNNGCYDHSQVLFSDGVEVSGKM